MSKGKVILILFVVLLIALIGSVLINIKNNNYGYANISFNLPSTEGLKATVNGKTLSISNIKGQYKLPSGDESLVVTDPGYRRYEVNFKLNKGQIVYINVIMQSNAPQNTGQANEQVTASLQGYLPQGFSLQKATYFYDNTWVVANVQTAQGDDAVLVAVYVGGSRSWRIVLGPGTVFTTTDTSSLPNDVAIYLNQQGYVLNEN